MSYLAGFSSVSFGQLNREEQVLHVVFINLDSFREFFWWKKVYFLQKMESYKCSECENKVFTKRCNLLRHIRNFHGNNVSIDESIDYFFSFKIYFFYLN